MREFAKVSPQFWISERGREIKRLGIEAQLLAFYLSTNPHASMIGIYYLPIAFIAHETGLTYDKAVEAMKRLENINYCKYDMDSEYIWVNEMGFEQIARSLKPQDNRVQGIKSELKLLPNLPFVKQFLDKYSEAFHLSNEVALEALESKEKEKEKENEEEKKKEKEKATRILDAFEEKSKKYYRDKNEVLNLIIARLRAGISEKECTQLAVNRVREWEDNPVMKPHINIETIFGPHFHKYLAEIPKEESEINEL